MLFKDQFFQKRSIFAIADYFQPYKTGSIGLILVGLFEKAQSAICDVIKIHLFFRGVLYHFSSHPSFIVVFL